MGCSRARDSAASSSSRSNLGGRLLTCLALQDPVEHSEAVALFRILAVCGRFLRDDVGDV